MKHLTDRPLFFLCLAFSAAVLSLNGLPSRLKLIPALAAGAAALILILLKKTGAGKRGLALWPLLPVLLGLFGGALSGWYTAGQTESRLRLDGEQGVLTARVNAVSYYSDYRSLFTATATEWNGTPVDFSVLISVPRECFVSRDDRVTLTVTLRRLPESENGFPVRSYYAARGILLTAEGIEEETPLISAGPVRLFSRIRTLSDTLTARFRLFLGEEKGGLCAGLLLGRREAVPDGTRRDFRFLGLSHVLAVSGLHLTVIVGGFLFLLRLVRIPRLPRLLLCTALILFFWFLTGFPASAVRAGIMLIFLLIARYSGADYDPLTALALAAALILAFSPASVSDIGFLLSVSATAGLILLGGPLASAVLKRTNRKIFPIRLAGKLLAGAAVSASAVFFTLPIASLNFGELSLLSPLTNLLFLPLVELLLFGAVLLAAGFGTPLAPILCEVTGDLAGGILSLAKKLGEAAPEPISLRYDFTGWAFFFAALAAVILLLTVKKRRFVTAAAASCLVFAAVFGSGLAVYSAQFGGDDRIAAVSIGRNDYLLLHTGGRTLLIDVSDGSYSSLSRAAELSRTALLDSSPDALLLTHLHRKHLSSFVRLTDNHRFRYLILPEPCDGDSAEFAAALTSLAEERGITVVTYASDRPASVAFDDCTVRLSGISFLNRSVQPLITFSIEGNGRVIYTGGGTAEADPINAILNDASAADLLILGIHGPLIKTTFPEQLLPPIVLASDDSVNEAYKTLFPVISDGKDICYKLIRLKRDP